MLVEYRFRWLAVSGLLGLWASPGVFATVPPGSIGLGIIAGEPTGLSGAYTLSPNATIDAALAYSVIRQDDWQIHSDYLFTGNKWSDQQPEGLDPYWGGGLRLKFESSTRFGIRLPGGATYQFDKQPVQFFGEVAPIVDVAPNLSLSINIDVGVRYFF